MKPKRPMVPSAVPLDDAVVLEDQLRRFEAKIEEFIFFSFDMLIPGRRHAGEASLRRFHASRDALTDRIERLTHKRGADGTAA